MCIRDRGFKTHPLSSSHRYNYNKRDIENCHTLYTRMYNYAYNCTIKRDKLTHMTPGAARSSKVIRSNLVHENPNQFQHGNQQKVYDRVSELSLFILFCAAVFEPSIIDQTVVSTSRLKVKNNKNNNHNNSNNNNNSHNLQRGSQLE